MHCSFRWSRWSGKIRPTPPQKQMKNPVHQESNVLDAFRLLADPLPGPVFLVDDLVDTKWTLTEVGVLLRAAGSGPVVPLALGSSMGRDS